MSTPMSTSQLTRRTSRSSGSQAGCRSSRIEKPRSNHNSPMALERRKTTSGTKRYATLDDHYNMMFGIAGEEEGDEDRRELGRPLSWHPSSTQFQVPSRSSVIEPLPSQDWTLHPPSARNSTHGSDFYSLSARNSLYPEQTQPTPHYPQSHDGRGSQSSGSSWQEASQQTPSYAMSSYSTPSTEPLPWYLREWAKKNQTQNVNSCNGSMDFLPIQHPTADQETKSVAEDEDEEMEASGKELVGMGLYDLPEPELAWDSSKLSEGTGKGLKLEETWQPPEDEEEEDADEASSDDGSVEELPAKDTALPINVKPQLAGNMEGQSFFFDEDDTYTKEWWFQQLKQPSVPVRDAGLGYGWL
ncbi:uncharacterized protein BDR25DRAFT_230647 [Lindgomyces ingoldianus]|uniref:Uncharacterized protein n=1 Tax=Lindgomyces ingoldianus TaxID=673940 RepID=A0ACB6QRZ2_9PLEO|nr:uncharacterized protein BDR25DRAFT_230647 [Lindgomyces ingoldianus]KAF2468847.1 hypothetical protein BDR25DRAFT_230647 [Lindgomyces ingoldianus]